MGIPSIWILIATHSAALWTDVVGLLAMTDFTADAILRLSKDGTQATTRVKK